MGRIDDSHLVSARAKVAAMDLATKERLADEVYRHQPNLLASVLALHGSEVSMPELDEMLNILFVCYQAMIETGKAWPEITLQDQEKHLARLTARIKFTEGLEAVLQQQAITDYLHAHPEKWLLAFVFDEIGAAGWSRIRTDKEKQLVLVALNIVECIAYINDTNKITR